MRNNKNIQSILEALLEEKDKVYYKEKIKKYKNECGCSMGGAFTIISVFFYAIYNFLILDNLSLFDTSKIIFLGILITIIAGLAGKMTGITVARIKLILLFHDLKTNFNKQTI